MFESRLRSLDAFPRVGSRSVNVRACGVRSDAVLFNERIDSCSQFLLLILIPLRTHVGNIEKSVPNRARAFRVRANLASVRPDGSAKLCLNCGAKQFDLDDACETLTEEGAFNGMRESLFAQSVADLENQPLEFPIPEFGR